MEAVNVPSSVMTSRTRRVSFVEKIIQTVLWTAVNNAKVRVEISNRADLCACLGFAVSKFYFVSFYNWLLCVVP